MISHFGLEFRFEYDRAKEKALTIMAFRIEQAIPTTYTFGGPGASMTSYLHRIAWTNLYLYIIVMCQPPWIGGWQG